MPAGVLRGMYSVLTLIVEEVGGSESCCGLISEGLEEKDYFLI